MIEVVKHLWHTVGPAGFVALWAVKATVGAVALRMVAPRWARWRRVRTGGVPK
ncbi:hypothetical protein [Pseudoruegeria sp. HB172150]|uniref:hypothetical protein n=1 Tax=Pseudoruegeria sp. HB172150 TaxID=2721164 RepID=UPI001556C5D9|nr:hypothetical protein [Pseudoruegeria sp. HB172150]